MRGVSRSFIPLFDPPLWWYVNQPIITERMPMKSYEMYVSLSASGFRCQNDVSALVKASGISESSIGWS